MILEDDSGRLFQVLIDGFSFASLRDDGKNYDNRSCNLLAYKGEYDNDYDLFHNLLG